MGPEAFQILQIVFATILGGASGTIIFLLKDYKRNQDRRLEKLEDTVQAMQVMLPQRYVQRDDFIRTMGAFDYKLDRIERTIGQLECVRRLRRQGGGIDEPCGE
jgi:hypothetical protein